MIFHVVKYSGPFGYIKPWTAVRDSETFSQQFLSPSTLEGIEKKLFPELLHEKGQLHKIKRYRLHYKGIDIQQERTWAKGGLEITKEKGIYKTNLGILQRGVLLEPDLYLAFDNKMDAAKASTQSICLCRNEDILLPMEAIEMIDADFEKIEGFELLPTEADQGFKVGNNRFNDNQEMFGKLIIVDHRAHNND